MKTQLESNCVGGRNADPFLTLIDVYISHKTFTLILSLFAYNVD